MAAFDKRQSVLHDSPHPRSRDFLGGRMNGNDHPLGFFCAQNFQKRIRHALETVAELQLTRYGKPISRLKGVHKPGLTKHRHHERSRGIKKGDLHQAHPRTRRFQLQLMNRALDSAGLANASLAYGFLYG